MLLPKKNSYKEFDNEKNSCGSRIPLPPPITFLLVRSLLLFMYLETVLRVSAKVNWAQGMGKAFHISTLPFTSDCSFWNDPQR